MDKEKTLLSKLVSFFILVVCIEIFLLHTGLENTMDTIFIAPIAFLLAKFGYDFILLATYKKKSHFYLEDYLKEIMLILILAVIAGGIVSLAEVFTRGNVRMSVLAAVTSLYLKK